MSRLLPPYFFWKWNPMPERYLRTILRRKDSPFSFVKTVYICSYLFSFNLALLQFCENTCQVLLKTTYKSLFYFTIYLLHSLFASCNLYHASECSCKNSLSCQSFYTYSCVLCKGWNDKIVVLKKATLQFYFKTFIEKIKSGNLIM